MVEKPRAVGRPTTAPKSRRKKTLGIRASADLARALDREAKRNARSLSQEAELRLERTFRDEALLDQVLELAFGPELAAMLMVIGRAMKQAGTSVAFFEASESGLKSAELAEAIEHWPNWPRSFDQAFQAARLVLESLRPAGDPTPPKPLPPTGKPDLDRVMQITRVALGVGLAKSLLESVRDPTGIGGEQKDWAERVRKMLGPTMERIDDNWRRMADPAWEE